jgi:hypothetical protein
MIDPIKCPRCKTEQQKGLTCVSCGLDFKKYEGHIKKKRSAKDVRNVRCPYCKTEQSLRKLCMKCGLDFKAYSEYIKQKKAGENVTPPRPPASPPAALTPQGESKKTAGGPMELEDLFKKAWKTFKKRWLTMLGLTVISIIFVIVSISSTLLIIPFVSEDPDPFVLVPVIAVIFLLAVIMSFGGLSILFAGASDRTLTIGGAIKTGVKRTIPFIWVMFLQGIIVTGGFFLFIVPGFIFMTWFLFTPYIMFTEDIKGTRALLKSREYVRGHGWDVFLKLVVIMVIYMVLASIPIIGPLFALPFMLIYTAAMYRDMVRVKGLETTYPSDGWSRARWPLLGAAGILGPVILIAVVLVPLVGTLKNLDTGGQMGLLKEFSIPESSTSLATSKDHYLPEESITVTYSAMPGNAQDWITVVGSKAPDDSYGEYFYTEGRAQGSQIFKGLDPGTYEVRAFHDWPNGGYEIKARYRFVVEDGGTDASPRLNMERDTFYPGEEITVRFSINKEMSIYGWAGIVHSSLPHGSESLNRENTSVFKLLDGRTSGALTFSAPSAPGSYDIRLHNTEGGEELHFVSFTVMDNSSPSTIRMRSVSDKPIKITVTIHTKNHTGNISLNGRNIYRFPEEADRTHRQVVKASLIAGINLFTVSHDVMPGAWETTLRIKVKGTDPETGKSRDLATWNVLKPSGTSDFVIEILGAGIKA